MLNLTTPTEPRWLAQVNEHLPEILVDHAHCEKKAAGVALNLIFAYVDQTPALWELSQVVAEELDHFKQVLELLARRGIPFTKLPPGGYGRKLSELVRTHEPARAIDRLLVAALIEARSCERFALLRDRIDDPELATFYGSLFESEARHYATYVQLARHFAPAATVDARLAELSQAEAAILASGETLVRMHS